MAMKELLELSSLLRGDDQERLELEREKSLLVALIEQHETRLLNESERQMYFAHDFEELLGSTDLEEDKVDITISRVNDIEDTWNALSKDNLLGRVENYIISRSELKHDIAIVHQCLVKMMSNLDSVAYVDIDDQAQTMSELRQYLNGITIVQDEIQCDISTTGSAADQLDQSLKTHQHNLKLISDMKAAAIEDFRRVSTQLSTLIDQLRKDKAHCLANIRDQETLEQQLQNDEEAIKNQHFLKLHHRGHLEGETKLAETEAIFVENKKFENASSLANLRRNVKNLQQEVCAENSTFGALSQSISSYTNTIEQLEKHKNLMCAQKNAYDNNSFKDKLNKLICESGSLLQRQHSAKQVIDALESELDSMNRHTKLSRTIESVGEVLERKSRTIADLRLSTTLMTLKLDEERTLMQTIDRIQSDIPNRSSCSIVFPSKISSVVASISSLTDMNFQLQKLTGTIRRQENRVSSLMFQNRAIKNLQALQYEEARMARRKREKCQRFYLLKADRINLHKESLQSITNILLQEDKIFQHNILTTEQTLRMKKTQLRDELEKIVALKKVFQKEKDVLKNNETTYVSMGNEAEFVETRFHPNEIRSSDPKRKACDVANPINNSKKKKQNEVLHEYSDVAETNTKPLARMRSGLSTSLWHPNKL